MKYVHAKLFFIFSKLQIMHQKSMNISQNRPANMKST